MTLHERCAHQISLEQDRPTAVEVHEIGRISALTFGIIGGSGESERPIDGIFE